MQGRIWIFAIFTLLTMMQVPQVYAQAEKTPKSELSGFAVLKENLQIKIKEWWDYWVPSDSVGQKSSIPKVVDAPAQSQDIKSTVPGQAVTPREAQYKDIVPLNGLVKPAKPYPSLGVNVRTESPAVKAMRDQPLFTSEASKVNLGKVYEVRDQIKLGQIIKITQPGRTGTSKLARNKAGIPISNWKSIKVTKKIPRLDIGTETSVSADDFNVEKLNWAVQKASDFKRLPTVEPLAAKEFQSALGTAVLKVNEPRVLQANFRVVGQPVSKEEIDKIIYNLQTGPEIKLQPYKVLPEETLKMVAALLLFEKGNSCHIIMGMFNNLAKAEKTKIEATYHLGACADQLGMHQAAFDNLSQVVASEDKNFASGALTLLAKDLPSIYEKDFYNLVKNLKDSKGLISSEAQDEVSYRMAKGAYRLKQYKSSLLHADKVSSSSDLSDHARFLSAMNTFALRDRVGALKKLEDLWNSLETRKVQDSNLRALASVNLARMLFSQKKYSEALDKYMQVPKDHALWVQALIEQGWTQLATEDYSGAIGNMYSLHSPYFKAVYQPESFVVRTIGYLNICQYGDAYKTLSWMEKDYRSWNNKLGAYLANHSQPKTLYTSVKSYIRGKSTEDVDGVPHQLWREMARRKDFLNLQTALNEKVDESERYEGVNAKIKEEKASIRWRAEQSKKRFDELKLKLTKAKTDRSLQKSIDQWRNSQKLERDLTIALRFQLAMLEQSRQGFLDFQKLSKVKLNRESETIMSQAGDVLVAKAKGIHSDMNRVLENNEFLRYEVFSGSGENIRYQVAGGEVGNANRVPAHIRPTKMMNWNFDGEFWVDEIGSYRSSLQNVCPTANTGTPAPRPQSDQAALGSN